MADMHSCGVAPTVSMYEVLLTSAVMQQQPPSACEDLLHEMMGFGMLPRLGHFDQLIVSYARYGQASEARRALGRMLALGLAPATRHYNHVLQVRCLGLGRWAGPRVVWAVHLLNGTYAGCGARRLLPAARGLVLCTQACMQHAARGTCQ